jgi:uncharacterized protein YciI
MEDIMKFLVICRPREDSQMDRFAALLSEEVEALRQLKARGVILEAWSPGRPGAILIVKANSESDVEGVVNRLPLAVAGLIEIELNPLLQLGI